MLFEIVRRSKRPCKFINHFKTFVVNELNSYLGRAGVHNNMPAAFDRLPHKPREPLRFSFFLFYSFFILRRCFHADFALGEDNVGILFILKVHAHSNEPRELTTSSHSRNGENGKQNNKTKIKLLFYVRVSFLCETLEGRALDALDEVAPVIVLHRARVRVRTLGNNNERIVGKINRVQERGVWAKVAMDWDQQGR